MGTLTVTSPLTNGPVVRRAQMVLNGENVFKGDWLRGKVDGEFGEETGRGCIRAKFWAGYPTGELKPTYGETLDAILTGKRKLPVANRVRRNRRLADAKKAAAEKTLGEKALEALAPDVGLTESPPNSNWTKFNVWYGMKGPWCAMTVAKAMVLAGSKAFVKSVRYAYVPYMVIDARAGANGLQIVKLQDVKVGDIFCVDWQGRGASPYDFDHTGFVRTKPMSGAFGTREGNTSSDNRGDQSNGGGLYDRIRTLDSGAFVFIRAGR